MTLFLTSVQAIKVRSALEVGSQTLRVTVTDRCGASGQMDVIITVEPLVYTVNIDIKHDISI
ncbi:hypothetical protein DPMN_176421 [Dreissena polymorpha]|uniref:Uncharacterized protein n=1 Tax=Dreissena polymorpha TaxID=45954 RepID=A0A9D4II27_DREPO|nr:hypothetical protein DPMN_176421 [Dreissena polymorpha]